MSALATLKAEIERKRKLAEQLTSKHPAKYVKKGDIERELVKQQLEKKKANSPAEESAPLPPEDQAQEITQENADQTPPISKEQLTKRLRERHEPIMLFGESDWQRWQRLKKLEEREPMEYIQGMDNEFGRALQALEDEQQEGESKKPDDDDLFKDTKDDSQHTSNSNSSQEDFIFTILKRLLGEWEQELNDRPDATKRTAQGKVDTVTYKQCRKHIKPLFKILKEKSLPPDILESVHEICQLILEREYVQANDIYLRMAIGNAPWPMGVTMVGIHERSAREKIFTNQVAHVLNDETQRKYIQAIKRIMTWAQHKYPNDPSKCVG